MKKKMSDMVVTALAAVIILGVTIYAGQRPYANWDMFPYVALAINEGNNPEDTHHKAYNLASEFLTPDDFESAARRQPLLRKDPAEFTSVLPYFSIKPGFVATTRMLVMAGVHPVLATYLPSLIAYCLLGWLLLWWLGRQLPAWLAALLTLCLMAMPWMTDTARYSSPDLTSALLFVAGAILLMSGSATGIWIAVLSCTFRPDAILAVTVLLLVAAQTGKVPLRHALVGFGAMVLLLAIILKDGPHLGSFLFTTTDYTDGWDFVKYFNPYFDGLLSGVASILHSWLPVFFLAGCVSVYLGAGDAANRHWWLLAIGLPVVLIVRYVLHPVIEDRMLIGIYVILFLGLVRLVAHRSLRA